MVDIINRNIRALRVMGRPVDNWDDLLITYLYSKLDSITVKEWDRTLVKDHIPNFKKIIEFLTQKCEAFETSALTSGTKPKVHSYVAPTKKFCVVCHKFHPLYKCE